MAEYIKEQKTIYKDRNRWVNEDTGEIIEADQVITKVDRQGFEITYLMYLFNLFNEIGGQKYKVVEYILKNKDQNNILILTQRKLAEKAEVSINTVTDTIKILKEANLIQTKPGIIMLHPKIAHKGSNSKEKFLLHKFEAFGDI